MRKPLWTIGARHHSPHALADADSAEMRLPGGDHNNNGCGWAMGVDGQGQKTCTVNNIFGNQPLVSMRKAIIYYDIYYTIYKQLSV